MAIYNWFLLYPWSFCTSLSFPVPDASSLPKGSKKGNIFSGFGNANLYGTCCHLCFYCGKWKTFCMEMVGFAGGRVSYVMTLVWTAVAWQVCSVGVVLLWT